jgi:hypothetical protein
MRVLEKTGLTPVPLAAISQGDVFTDESGVPYMRCEQDEDGDILVVNLRTGESHYENGNDDVIPRDDAQLVME